MPVVQSLGTLTTPRSASYWPTTGSGSVTLYGHSETYARIYATQPNVRTCVDFLARNIAQVPLHAYRRISDTDRERLVNHELIQWIGTPNSGTRRYRLFETLVADLGIYFNAYWLKVPWTVQGRAQIALVRLPPEEVTVTGNLLPSSVVWRRDGQKVELALADVVIFNGYNPLNPLIGLSPLETLRRVLAEEQAAGAHREAFWRNSGRIEGIVTRPKEAKRYTPEQAASWREQYQQIYSGGAGAGKTLLLQDGETFTPTAWSPKDSEYVSARKLTREECASAYHIPLPMVGILDHATYSNIKEQHKQLYADTLGPWFELIQQELEGQLLVDCADQENVYLEFNIADKLKGSFEEQASALNLLVRRAIMTPNEGRARLNLSRLDDPSADELAEQAGVAPSAQTPAPPEPPPEPEPATEALVAPVLTITRARIDAALAKLPAPDRPAAFLGQITRWNRELETDLLGVVQDVVVARTVAMQSNADTLTRLQQEVA